jgi:hypothetical protein
MLLTLRLPSRHADPSVQLFCHGAQEQASRASA